jgi:glycogen debranching enzyme
VSPLPIPLSPWYNPIGYHRGTVWPHDNSIIVAGMTRYGYRAEAKRVAMATADAAAHFNNRLPEAWAGYPRAETGFPIEYPTACSPQAWSSAAVLLHKRAAFGAEPQGGKLVIDPDIPESIGRVRITGLEAFGTRWDLEAVESMGSVRPTR